MYTSAMSTPKSGITADRKTPEGIKFIVDNYTSMKNTEIASHLGQTPRWVKRQISLLKKKGLIKPKRSTPEVFLEKSSWTPAMIDRVKFLSLHKKMSYRQISSCMKREFGISVSKHVVGWWLRRFGIKSIDNQEWLQEHVDADCIKEMLSRGLRVVDMVGEIESKRGVHVNDDDVLLYIKNLGLDGQRWYQIKRIRGVVEAYSDEDFEDALKYAGSVSAFSRKIGVSKTVLRRRMVDSCISVPERRISWSADLDTLRSLLFSRDEMNLRPAPHEMHQMILGWLMGDGHLDITGRFVVNHTLSQVSYLYVKAQILRERLTNVVTVPRKGQAYEECLIVSEEQIGISCPGFKDYVRYLNEDGSKNFEMIASELDDLGRACYFMDDGSAGDVVTVATSLVDVLKNKFFFRNVQGKKLLHIDQVPASYILPCFWYKSSDSTSIGSYWSTYFPELFNPVVNDDLDLSFVNTWVVESTPSVLDSAVDYYRSRGFPLPSYGDEYLSRSWELIKSFESKYLWKDNRTLRYANLGDELFKHFMPHMCVARYRKTSPMKAFSGYSTLSSSLRYCLNSNKSILPKFVYNALMFFNGGVTAFPSVISKAVVEAYSDPGAVVVDPCAGWGGRMLGALSCGRSYTGFEPWDESYQGLCAIRDYVSGDNCSVIHGDFDPLLAPVESDLVFTSPPYVDLEIYGRPMKVPEWKILVKSIMCYAESSLRVGGFLVLNLPKSLRHLLPPTTLSEQPLSRWNTRSRSRSGEPLYIWKRCDSV